MGSVSRLQLPKEPIRVVPNPSAPARARARDAQLARHPDGSCTVEELQLEEFHEATSRGSRAVDEKLLPGCLHRCPFWLFCSKIDGPG